MAKKRMTLSDLLNDLTFNTFFNKYKMIALNMFEWEHLPTGIEEKHIEEFLFDWGTAVFFRDPAMSFMCLKADSGGQLNVYGDPLGWWATGFNYHKLYSADDCVVISNNKPRIPTREYITFYANKLTECERTMDVNVKACKTPFIFACDDKDVLSFKQIFAKVDGNEPAIYADRGLNLDSLQVFKTGVTFLGNDLQDFKHSVENELLTFLGMNNIPIDKKERLITDEAQANNDLIQSFSSIQLESRQKAVDEINALYGLNISVKIRTQSDKQETEKEVKDDAFKLQ